MACDRCGESREAGHRFCIGCGEPIPDCPQCSGSKEKGFSFCPSCGRPLNRPSAPGGSGPADFLKGIGVLAAILLAALLIIEVAVMFLGAGDVWSWAADNSYKVFILKPGLDVLGYLGGTGLQAFWIVLILSATASVALVLRQALPALRAPEGRKGEELGKTPLYWIAVLLCADMLLSLVLGTVMMPGTETDVVVGFVPESLYSFANAAVWEEVICRVVYMGIPMVILAALCGRRDAPKYLLGGFGISRAVLILIVVSAVIFGFAHAPGWGMWKVLPTFISGLALGYLYARFGIHASIAFHFAVDYMATMMAGPVVLVVTLVMMLMALLGIPCLVRIGLGLWESRGSLKDMPWTVPDDQDSIFFRRR